MPFESSLFAFRKHSFTMKHLIIDSLLFLMICSCGQTGDNALNIIILDHFASSPQKINIDEIAAHIDYIQLETTPSSLIARIEKIQTKEDKIYILDAMTRSILVFDISGKFIRRIATKGRGPGEYISITDFALCDSVILVRDGGQAKVILYDSLGRLIAETYTISNYIDRVAFYKGMAVGSANYPRFAYNNGFRISLFDRNLNPVSVMLKSEIDLDEASANQYGMGHSRSFFANVNDTLTFWECRDDVVYKIVDENEIIKKYIFKYKNPAKFEDGMDKRNSGCNEITSMKEGRNHIFMVGGYDNEYRRLIYFKKTNKGVCVDGMIQNSNGPDFFPAGIDGGLADDGKAYRLFSVYDYKTAFENSKTSLENLDPKLQSLLETCQVDDNPCIMLVTLK